MKLLNFLFILLSFSSFGQFSKEEILTGRRSHNDELLDPEKKILTPEEIESFNGLDYFPFDSTYQITAIFKKEKGPEFEMPTTTNRTPLYRKYGIIKFSIKGEVHVLNVYQNIELSKSKEYKNYLNEIDQIAKQYTGLRSMGSASINLAYTAAGKLDAYWGRNLNLWDVSSGILLVTEAGGKISKPSGENWDINSTDILASNGYIHQKMIQNLLIK